VIEALRNRSIDIGVAAVFAPWPFLDLRTAALRSGMETVLIASRSYKWKHRPESKVRLDALKDETICVIEADLTRVLHELPRPRQFDNRIVVENYVAVLNHVRGGAEAGFFTHI